MKLLLVVLSACLTAQGLRAESVDTILARMDEASQTFKAMSADVRMTTFTKVINDTSVENGTLKMQRQKGKGTRAVMDFSAQGDPRVLAFFGNIVRIYFPKLKTYQDYDVGHSDVLNQFLLLGFGSSGKELVESYAISSPGTEKIASQDTTKLVLLPKAAKVQEKLSKVEVWIPIGAAYPLQQQFYEPSSGNYRVVLYSNIKLNPPIKGTLEFHLPAGTKKQGS
jgi:outer membrane lipoprotein-sorting protein